MAVPEGWTDVDETLTAPGGNTSGNNGVTVVLGFREYILTHDWQADDVPLENEHGDGNGAEAGTAQLFACTRLRYTPAKGVYKDEIGRQLQAAQQEMATLRAQLAEAEQGRLSGAQRAAIRAVADGAAQLAAAFAGAETGGAHGS